MNEEINNTIINQSMTSSQTANSTIAMPTSNAQNTQINNTIQADSNREKAPIIVNGIDVSKISAFELDEDLIDEMTEEQADQYLIGKSDAEIAAFNEKNGFSVSMVLSDEELAKRQAERAGFTINIGRSPKEESNTPKEPISVKTEQTGSIVFGVKK